VQLREGKRKTAPTKSAKGNSTGEAGVAAKGEESLYLGSKTSGYHLGGRKKTLQAALLGVRQTEEKRTGEGRKKPHLFVQPIGKLNENGGGCLAPAKLTEMTGMA